MATQKWQKAFVLLIPITNVKKHKLHLNHNKIKEIPEAWQPGVSYLELSHNLITEIPESWNVIGEYLFLDYNHISEIPSKWAPQIDYLFLEGNPITHIPEDWNPKLEELYISVDILDDSLELFKKRNSGTIIYGHCMATNKYL